MQFIRSGAGVPRTRGAIAIAAPAFAPAFAAGARLATGGDGLTRLRLGKARSATPSPRADGS
jgi:hypothetical protein